MRANARKSGDGWWDFGKTPVAWQTFEIALGDTCIVPAAVNGKRVEAILDSGAGATILDRRFAASLGLGKGEARTLTGLSGRTGVDLVHDVEVGLGRDVRRLPFVIVDDLAWTSTAFGRDVDLLVGADMFADRCIALDFASKRFVTAAPGAFAGGPGWRALPLTRGAKQELLATASIAGSRAVSLMVDLGSSSALMLSSTYVAEHLLLRNRPASSAAVGGVDGINEATLFTVDRVDLGGLQIDAVPTLGMRTWQVQSAVGNIGLPLLGQFDVVFDVSASRLWLRPLPTERRLPMLKDRSGLGLAHEGVRLRVMHVAPNSPAAGAGWMAGQEITRVNGIAVDGEYSRNDQWRWRYGIAGTSVRLTTSYGEQRTIRLADYF